MKDNKITVVTVCFNAEDCIEKTIQSVLDQDYGNIEYIIIDGKSRDNTVSIINKYASRITFFISEKDEGIYDAMNKAIDLATGEWINFMNAGDTFADNKVLSYVNSKINNESHVLFGDTMLIDGTYHRLSKGQLYSNRFPDLGHQSTFVRTNLMKQFHYDLKYKVSADFAFLYMLYTSGYHFQYENRIISFFDISGLSSSHRALLYQEHCNIRGVQPNEVIMLKYRVEDRLPIWLTHFITRIKYALS